MNHPQQSPARQLIGNSIVPVALGLFSIGLVLQSKELLAIDAMLVGWMYCCRDLLDDRPDSVTAMTFYGLSSGFWYGLGNLVGYWADGSAYHARFYVYESLDHIFQAQVIITLAAIVPLFAFDFLRRETVRHGAFGKLPTVGFSVSREWMIGFCLLLTALCWSTRLFNIKYSFLGSMAYAIDLGPNIAIFLCTMERLQHRRPPMELYVLPIALMIIEICYQTLFSFMRGSLMWPIISTFLPYVLLKRASLQSTVATALILLVFIWLSKQIGDIRDRAHGTDRLAHLLSAEADYNDLYSDPDQFNDKRLEQSGMIHMLARFSTFNQVSQCVRLVEEEGVYKGQTIEYAIYLLIPRVIWPDKPQVRPGQWFARKLGRGSDRVGGSFSNAVNMTIPGELFLNFSYIGMLLGLVVMATLYWLIWESTAQSNILSNPINGMCRLFLLHQAIFNGSHLGAVFHLVICYLVCLLMTMIFSIFVPPQPEFAGATRQRLRNA